MIVHGCMRTCIDLHTCRTKVHYLIYMNSMIAQDNTASSNTTIKTGTIITALPEKSFIKVKLLDNNQLGILL